MTCVQHVPSVNGECLKPLDCGSRHVISILYHCHPKTTKWTTLRALTFDHRLGTHPTEAGVLGQAFTPRMVSSICERYALLTSRGPTGAKANGISKGPQPALHCKEPVSPSREATGHNTASPLNRSGPSNRTHCGKTRAER